MSWPSLKLHDICRPRQWKTISASSLLEEGYPVYGANGKIGFYSEYTHELPTLMITCRGATCGNVHISEPESYINGNAMALDELDCEKVDIRYLYYYLLGRGFNDVISGSAQPQITGQGLTKVEIPLPPLPEQRRIAAILDKADAIRRKRQQAIQLADDFLRAVFLDMFGDPVTNPRGWEVRPLIELIDPDRPITYGILMPGDDVEGGVPYVRVLDMKDGVILVDQVRRTTIEIAQQYRRSSLKAGDVLMSIRGHVGRLAVVPKDLEGANITQDTARFATNSSCSSLYLFACLNSRRMQQEMQRFVKGAAVKGINLSDVKGLKIPIPPIALQKKMERNVELITEALILMERSSEWSSDGFESISQKAFSGQL